MFRKPKKIQRRVFCADDDDDAEPEPPPPPIISQESLEKKEKREKKENKPVKSVALLSFADEEEECEEFKVKKSSQSKRLSKRRDKERKRLPDGDSNKYDSNGHEENINQIEKETNHVPIKPKKKVTLEGLILSGREALAADGTGDVSEEDGEGDEEEEDDRGFHRYRADSVRAALAGAPGHIPDAALIHAARKTRQQARELGDFVPIHSSPVAGSRLVREGDDSADDEEDRIQVRGLEMPSDKPQRGTAAIDPDDDANSELEEWEEQQMQKAMPAIIDITVAPPPPRMPMAPHLRPLAAVGASIPPGSAQQLVAALTERLEELQLDRINTANKREQLQDQLLNVARIRESRAARRGELDAAYRRAQTARGYLTDLIECLDEKMPQLEALESRALALQRRRHDFLVERRRADLRDQTHDVLALAALFADALEAWRGVQGVCARLAAWRRRDRAAYSDSHLPAALPKLLAPYVRQQLILWNPLADEDNEDYEKMEWYK
ncbi:putative gc-rich sequence DNA-binding factor [Operophtera brumata]|uniref:Putative gc-rich sequence DNA-binding factor n=1 Tax=Operophtera brumata TaxID=104452 RepID=A0A0L7LD32_OPEBR|nr:putative gc-rich sequence DNA-binding factor [Operophtera brumata]